MTKNYILILIIFISITKINSISINCEIINVETWKDIFEIYQCKVKTQLLITEPGITIDGCSSSQHLLVQNDSKINEIQIFNQTVNFLPFGFSNCFINLISLNIENSKLVKIRQENLKEFQNLKFLLLPGNLIEIIEKDLFELNPNVIYINLKENLLKIIDTSAFAVLKELEFLNLQNNTCIDVSINETNDFKELITNINENCSEFELPMIENINFKFFVGFTVTAGILTVIKTVVLFICKRKRSAVVEIE